MTKKLRLRAPLVITVAAGAALSACGGAVVTPTVQCPADPPSAGSPCDPSVQRAGSCGYGMCLGRPVVVALCDAGSRTWRVSTRVCEIPPPARACPSAQPADGARCEAGVDPESCNYGWSDCLRGPAVNARCEGGAWRIAVSTCNPPAPACPAVAPLADAPCVGALSCNYGDCAGSPTTYARCDAGRWQVAMTSCNPPPPPVPECPTTTPLPGSACGRPNGAPVCVLGTCDGRSSVPTALCLDGRWALQSLACEPSAPPASCPSAAPIEGDPCTDPATTSCTYGSCGSGPALTYLCRGGRWSVQRAMCGDYCPPTRPRAGTACSRDAAQPCRYPGAVCGDTQLQNDAACNPMTNRWVITEYVCR